MAGNWGGKRPGAGRPKGSKDSKPRQPRILTEALKAQAAAFAAEHIPHSLLARQHALDYLVSVVNDTKATTHDRTRAAGILVTQTAAAVGQAPAAVVVNLTEQRSNAVALVLGRLDALAAADQADADRAAEQRADPMADVFGDIPGSTGWPAIAELTAAGHHHAAAEPMVIDAEPEPITAAPPGQADSGGAEIAQDEPAEPVVSSHDLDHDGLQEAELGGGAVACGPPVVSLPAAEVGSPVRSPRPDIG